MTLPVIGPEFAACVMSDGVRLDADLYRPAGGGPWPVLLMRQPYGRAIASTVCYAHPAWYAAQGFIVVVQDVRGRGTSQGRFRLFADDRQDGAETIAWAAGLPGASGRVGMYGFSYQGSNQLLAASAGPPQLRAIAPAMIGWDVRNDWAFENGALCLRAGVGWALQMAAEGARLAGDDEAFLDLRAAAQAPAFDGSVPARPAVLERHRGYTHYFDWLDEPSDSAYWRAISPSAMAPPSVPAMLIGGWFDSHLPGTLAAHRALCGDATSPHRLVVGPWLHLPWGRRAGEIDFGPEAISDIDHRQVRWFDRWLKDADVPDEAPMRLFDMGSLAWTELDAWPDGTRAWHLAGEGTAALDPRTGVLSPFVPDDAVEERLVHDPWRPVPSVGGAFGAPNGPVDRSSVDGRPDVLTFTSAPLASPLCLAGPVAAELAVSCDRPCFDVSCVLSRVDRSGRAVCFADGYASVPAPAPGVLRVPMRATCLRLAPGERLRLSIAAASFPAYPVNPGTGLDPTRARWSQAQVTTLGIRCGGASGSRLDVTVRHPPADGEV